MSLTQSMATLAFVNEALEKEGDIVAALAPLFAPIASDNAGKLFDPKEFSQAVDQRYGLRMHPFIADDWAHRLARGEFAILDEEGGGEKYSRYRYKHALAGQSHQDEEQIEAALSSFRDYVRPHLERMNLAVPSSTNLDKMFFDRLKEASFQHIASKPEKEIIKSTTLTLKGTQGETVLSPTEQLEQVMDVAVASFYLEAQVRNPTLFNYLSDIAAGALAAEVVLSFRVPPKRGDNFSNKTVILDTPLVLDALGLGTREQCEYADLLLDDLKSEGAKVAMLSHCLPELLGIVDASLANLDGRGESLSGAIGTRFRFDKSAILVARSVKANARSALNRKGIDIINSEASHLYNIFSEDDEKDVIARIRPFSQSSFESREVDGLSVSYMIRHILKGGAQGAVMSYDTLFITRNTGLASAAHRIMKDDAHLHETSDPPFLTDRYLGGMLWLARGGVGSVIAHRKLVANCATAMRPRRDVLRKAVSTLYELDPKKAEELEAIVTNERCALYLMKRTLGSAELITTENAPELYEEVRRETAAEVAAEKEKEAQALLAAQKEEHDQALTLQEQQHNDVVAILDEKAKKAEKTAKSLEEKSSYLQSHLQESQEHQDALADAFERARERERKQTEAKVNKLIRDTRSVKYAYYLVVCCIIAGAYVALAYIGVETYEKMAIYFFATLAATFIAFGAMPNFLLGKRIEARRRRALEAALAKDGIDIPDEQMKIDWQAETAEVSLPPDPALAAIRHRRQPEAS